MKEGFYYRSECPDGPPRLTQKELAQRAEEADRRRLAEDVAHRHMAVIMPLIEVGKIDEARAVLDRFASEAEKPTRDEHCRRYISWASGDWLVYKGLNAWKIDCVQCPACGLCQITEKVGEFKRKRVSGFYGGKSSELAVFQ